MSSRRDSLLIKNLHHYWGKETALAWQRLPHIDLSGPTLKRVFGWCQPAESLPERVPDFRHLPFNDCLLDFGAFLRSETTGEAGHLWARVTESDKLLRAWKSVPWWPPRPGGPPPTIDDFEDFRINAAGEEVLVKQRDILNVEVWVVYPSTEREGKIWETLWSLGPELGAIWKEDPWAGLGVSEEEWAKKKLDDKMRADILADGHRHMSLVRQALAYLMQCPDFMVETRSTTPRTPKEIHTAKAKPWLREDLTSVIFIDPEKAHLHRERPQVQGTHASPRPHHRRGYVRALYDEHYYRGYDPDTGERWRDLYPDPQKKPRTVYVRPTIVGDPEWIFQGQHYRVINAKEEVE